MYYEVDLRDRQTGGSIECIYSGDNHQQARMAMLMYNEKLPDYDIGKCFYEYKGDGDPVAHIYYVSNKEDLHGVGKY